jgi:hypothetical protein
MIDEKNDDDEIPNYILEQYRDADGCYIAVINKEALVDKVSKTPRESLVRALRMYFRVLGSGSSVKGQNFTA